MNSLKSDNIQKTRHLEVALHFSKLNSKNEREQAPMFFIAVCRTTLAAFLI